MKFQIRLGTLLLLFTLAGWLCGWYGPRLNRWVRAWRVAPPPLQLAPVRAAGDADDTLPYYLEPAETPLE